MNWDMAVGATFCWDFKAARRYRRSSWRDHEPIREPFPHPGGEELRDRIDYCLKWGVPLWETGRLGGQSAGEGRRLYGGNHPPDMALGPYQFHVCSKA